MTSELTKDLSREGMEKLRRTWIEAVPLGEFWALVAAVFLFNFGMSVFFFLYNLFMLDLGFEERSLGVLASALALGSMVGTIPMGVVAQRFGVKRVLITCLLLMALAFGARVVLFWYPTQIAFAFLDGVLLSGWVVSVAPAVANAVEVRKRPVAFSVIFAVGVATGSLGGFIGGNMPGWCRSEVLRHTRMALSVIDGKRATLLMACIFTALAAWPISKLGAGPRMQSTEWPKRPSSFLLKFLLGSALWAAAVGAFNPFTNVFFVRYLGVPLTQLGDFFSIAQLVQAAAVLLMPLVLRKTGLISGIMAAQLATAATLVLLAVGHRTWHEEVFYCAFLAGQHMCEPALQSLLMNRVDEGERSSAAAMYFLVISVAQAGAAMVAGASIARFNYPPVLIGISIAAAAAALGFRTFCSPIHDVAPNQ